MKTREIVGGSLLLFALTTSVQAGTVIGTPVVIEGLQNLSATVNAQSKGGVGKSLGILMALGGLATLCMGRPGIGMAGLGGGIAMAFVPNIIGTAFDATAAAPLLAVALPQATSVMTLQGMAYAAMYLPLLAWRLVQDPVILTCVAGTWCGWCSRRRHNG